MFHTCYLFQSELVLISCHSVLGEELGEPRYSMPFLAPNTTGKDILYGVNYASGGGGILNATGALFVSIFLQCYENCE